MKDPTRLYDLRGALESRLHEAKHNMDCALAASESKAPIGLMNARIALAQAASTLSKLRSAIDAELELYQPQDAARAMLRASVAEMDQRDRFGRR